MLVLQYLTPSVDTWILSRDALTIAAKLDHRRGEFDEPNGMGRSKNMNTSKGSWLREHSDRMDLLG